MKAQPLWFPAIVGLYRATLLLWPRAVRQRVGEPMVAAFGDACRNEYLAGGSRRLLARAFPDLIDSLRGVVAEHWRASRRRSIAAYGAHGETPPPRHDTRSPGVIESMANLSRDFRHALRSLRKQPAFAIVTIATLALGMGATTAVFSFVDAVLLQPLPFENPDELVMVRGRLPVRNRENSVLSAGAYSDLIHETTAFQEMAAVVLQPMPMFTGTAEPEQVPVAIVTHNFFSMLGVQPQLGRGFSSEDPDLTIILSHGYWQARFAGDSGIVGRKVNVGDSPADIVGVLPRGLVVHIPTTDGPPAEVDAWLVARIDADPNSVDRMGGSFLTVFGRLAPGMTIAGAQFQADAVAEVLRADFARFERVGYQLDVFSLHSQIVGNTGRSLLVFLGAVAFVLLIACANVANLILVRVGGRSTELAVRAALGAGRSQLVRSLLAESVILAGAGALVGIGVAYAGVNLGLVLAPVDLPRTETIGVDSTALAFTLILAVGTALLFGLAPAATASRAPLIDALRRGGSSNSGGRRRTSRSLVVAEVALSVVLLVGAGLMLRSFVSLAAVQPGYDVDGVHSFRANLPQADDDLLLERIRGIPGVRAAGAATGLPLTDGIGFGPYVPDNVPFEEEERYPAADRLSVTPGYFEVMNIELLRGRLFEESDIYGGPGGTPANRVIIDRELAESVWPAEDPIGHTLRQSGADLEEVPWEIVGVVAHTRARDLREDGNPLIYFLAHAAGGTSTFVVHTELPAADLLTAVRAELRAIDPGAPLYESRSLRSMVDGQLAPTRFALALTGGFAAAALLLAVVGLYGVIAHTVRQRRREMGIRLALGARAEQLHRLVVHQGMHLVLPGVVVGLVGALVLSRFLGSLLYEVEPADPATFVGITMAVTLVAFASTYVSARRSTPADPVEPLRQG